MSKEPPNQQFRDYLEKRSILIVDPGAAARTSIARCLGELGAASSKISMTGNYDSALNLINTAPPDILICDYNLGNKSGLGLVQVLRRKSRGSPEPALIVLATANSNESSVAEAAEEEVDGYLLKPFTNENMVTYLSKVVRTRTEPDPYRVEINRAKELILQGDLETARDVLKGALERSDKPALAYFYLGQVDEKKSEVGQAEKNYSSGLKCVPLHYRCLVALFHLLFSEKRHAEAYSVSQTLAENFPISSNLLNSVLRLAITTGNFDHIDHFYDVYAELDYRDAELFKVMTAALVVSGKFALKHGRKPDAVELFRKALATSNRSPSILRQMVIALIHGDAVAEADGFLKEFPAEQTQTPDYQVSRFMVAAAAGSLGEALDLGRRLYQSGLEDREFYGALAHYSRKAGQDDFAETVLQKSSRLWPETKKS